MNFEGPRFVAFCGAPGAGKSEACRILVEERGAYEVDTGYPMRSFAMQFLGANHVDVQTQEGKLSPSTIPGKSWRDVLGELAVKLEELHPRLLIDIAMRRCQGPYLYVFSSARRDNGRTVKEAGGRVIQIYRPGFHVVNEFDQYDLDCIDTTIINDGSPEDLKRAVLRAIN